MADSEKGETILAKDLVRLSCLVVVEAYLMNAESAVSGA